ncbi:MAG: phosphate butyryltransferase [Bacteroidales bacterium]|nr:MAG: phosphate butyryltransferase [Bacteroidales bacterium]
MRIRTLNQMFEVLKGRASKRLIVALANDEHTIEAVHKAIQLELIEGILVGNKAVVQKILQELEMDPTRFRIVHEPDESRALSRAVSLINEGEGDLIMKGLVSTDKYMKALLDKEKGLIDPGAILSHVSVLELENYHKLLVIGDVAIIPLPELKEKVAIANYLIDTAHALGIDHPKVAVLAATERVLPGMQACIDAAILSKMAERGQIKGGVIDGPLALDVAIDKESSGIKKIKSDVAGDADCLLFPNIESGNVFYKYHTKLAGGELGAVVAGARVPAILSSRGDNVNTKLYSIALGALLAR